MPNYPNMLFNKLHKLSHVVTMLYIIFSAPSAVSADSEKLTALMNKAQSKGDIRVIVTLQKSALPDRATILPHDFDMTLKDKVSRAQSATLNRLSPAHIRGSAKLFPYTEQFAIRVSKDGLAELNSDPSVLSIQEDIPVPPVLAQSVPQIFPGHAISPYTGLGWNVAILDTGVDKTHPFLTGKVISEACYSDGAGQPDSTSLCPGGVSSSTVSGSGIPCVSGCEHGTHVAGIAAGKGNSFTGVAKDAGLIAIQVFSSFPSSYCGYSPCILSWTSDQILGLQHVYALRSTFNIASVNMSLGGDQSFTYCDTDSRKLSIDNLRSVGIATVIASGNDGYNDSVSYPGCISSAITVGATEHTVDTRAYFSNSGPQLDLYAPGVSINSSIPGGGFAAWSGTSMATPHVAGAWAVLRQSSPALSVDNIEAALKGTGATISSNGINRQRIAIDDALAFLGFGGNVIGNRSLYIPLVPCRIVDTRIAGGKIVARTGRNYLVSGSSGDIVSQGGTGDCGVPSDAQAVVLNITSNQPSNEGFFSVYPYNSPLPNATILNFTANQTIANSTVSAICQPACLSDITIYSSSTTHLIVDVVGYMQ